MGETMWYMFASGPDFEFGGNRQRLLSAYRRLVLHCLPTYYTSLLSLMF